MNYDLVVFDVDGTLTDTGVTHVRWCNDINREMRFGLPEIDLNDKAAVKKLLGTPMATIIRNYGFPEIFVDALVQKYERTFGTSRKYTSSVFPGIEKVLRHIKDNGVPMGIVTSNVRKNVARDLGGSFFNFYLVLDKADLESKQWSKKEALIYMQARFNSSSPVYIGDTIKDREAAKHANFNFIGVSYGWEIEPTEEFPVARDSEELLTLLK